MKAATTRGIFANTSLITRSTQRPTVGVNDVLVEVHASSVNPKDWKLNTIISSLTPKLGALAKINIIGDDLAGVVVEKGAHVSDFAIGDEVYGMDMRLRTAACAEYAVISEKSIAHKPKNMSFAEAASVPLAALTALQAFYLGGVQQGSKVLVIGASGGVGTFAVQIGKAMGAHITGVCSGKNSELVAGLGAEKVIDYTRSDFLQETDDYDVVFDVTAYQSLSSCSSLMAEQGVFISTAGHGKALFNTYRPHFSQGTKTAKAIWVKSRNEDLDKLKTFIEGGLVNAVIDSAFTLDNIQQAYVQSQTGRSKGKVVILVKQ